MLEAGDFYQPCFWFLVHCLHVKRVIQGHHAGWVRTKNQMETLPVPPAQNTEGAAQDSPASPIWKVVVE